MGRCWVLIFSFGEAFVHGLLYGEVEDLVFCSVPQVS